MNALLLGAAVVAATIPIGIRLARSAAPSRCPACEQSLTAEGEPIPVGALVTGVFECPTCGTRVDRRGRVIPR
jgi:predicted RNA-binding Zn-ribbon protein involved in translation (DUF1610 family)